MLLLQRNVGEIINIGDDVEIHVVRINPYSVILGFDGSQDVKIWRNEIYRALREGKTKQERIVNREIKNGLRI